MKTSVTSCIILFTFLLPGICFAEAPHELAGFVLGKPIDAVKARIMPDTDIPIRHLESMHEVEIRPTPGYKTGLIWYATCSVPRHIVRIKLKYKDSSKKFFKQLLKRFKDRFGEPTEWRGDPFHIVVDWKWSFTDKANNTISLHLQHNTRDVDEKLGNAVKFTMTSAIASERRCFQKREQDQKKKDPSGKRNKGRKPMDLDQFVPR